MKMKTGQFLCFSLTLACVFSFRSMESVAFWFPASESELEIELFPKKTFEGYRDYDIQITESEKDDIRFILKSLAQKSLTSLWSSRSQLESAGLRIDHLHPLRFFEYVFTDEELKVYINNIKKRGSWVWGEFIKGIKTTFQEEMALGNMKEEFLIEFVHIVGIDLAQVQDLFNAQEWEDFVKKLIAIVPRDGDSGRYDQ